MNQKRVDLGTRTDSFSSGAALGAPCILALVHVLARYVNAPEKFRMSWKSFVSGAALAYVFIHILPVIARHAVSVGQEAERWQYAEWVFVTALAGTCAYYGVEKFTRASNHPNGRQRHAQPAGLLFFVHIAAFGLYNCLIGYMVIGYPPRNSLAGGTLYGVLVLHFFSVDQNLRAKHRTLYDNVGQWIMSGAVLGGAFAGAANVLPQPLVIASFHSSPEGCS
ncbi:hypothetical protein [Pelagibacterium luteolum]|uniref:hypothetical protein n=1 Tax=Pelagibacterium luteolum TaxID=440168 RepID=UPI00115FE5C7|nr:hypothetical protein [Pelagibacterium luteolum]